MFVVSLHIFTDSLIFNVVHSELEFQGKIKIKISVDQIYKVQ